MTTLVEAQLCEEVIGAAIEVHRELGPGLLEGVYERALMHELGLCKLSVARQQPVWVEYKGAELAEPFYVDIVVDGRLVIEIKACEHVHPIHRMQLLTYLRLAGLRVGLLLNFGQLRLRDGLVKVVNPR